MSKFVAMAAGAAVVLGLGTAGAFVAFAPEKQCSGSAIATGADSIGGPFVLVNGDGVTVTNEDVITGPTMVYFGFTYCPDFCPTDLARNAAAIDLLAERGIEVASLFITVDPTRDTPEVVKEYAEVMHPDMIGLTGTPEQVDAASKAYKTYYRKNGTGEDYLMDHSTFTYLMDPDGFVDFFRSDTAPEAVVERTACHVG